MDKHTHPNPAHGKHWHYLNQRRHRRLQTLGVSRGQMAFSQVFGLASAILAGFMLEYNKISLALLAGAFVLLPGIFDLVNSIGASMSAKINHRLESPEEKTFYVVLGSMGYAFVIAVGAGALVAALGGGVSAWLFEADFQTVFTVGFGAVLLSALIGFPMIGLLSVGFRRYKINPDDVIGPMESSIFTILVIISLAMMIGWQL